MSAHLLAMGRKDVYPCRYMDDFVKAVDVLRVKKAPEEPEDFLPPENAQLTFGCQSSYLTLDGITQQFGTRFSHINAEQVFDEIDALTPEEKAEASHMADELVSSAKGVHMPAEYVKK